MGKTAQEIRKEIEEAFIKAKQEIRETVRKYKNSPEQTLENGIIAIFVRFAEEITPYDDILIDLNIDALNYADNAKAEGIKTGKQEKEQEIKAERSKKYKERAIKAWKAKSQPEIDETIRIAKILLEEQAKENKKYNLSSLEKAISNYCANKGIEHKMDAQTYKSYLDEDSEIVNQLDNGRRKIQKNK